MTKMSDMSHAEATEQLAALLAEVDEVAADLPEDILAEVESAKAHPLDAETARSLYTRVLEIVRSHGSVDGVDTKAEIRAQVEAAVGSVERPPAESAHHVQISDPIELVDRHGLSPHAVVPVPTFNGVVVSMHEGYVKAEDLTLWAGNNRIELHVEEFREENGRGPDGDELLKLMQGLLLLPSQASKDPFQILPLAESIARKGVERAPIVTWQGEPKDGNRRIAAALFVLHSTSYTTEQKERARYIRVWRAPEGTTDDQFEAVVVALNFEEDHKIEWEEYIKARLVHERYHTLVDTHAGRLTDTANKQIKRDVADHFAIPTNRVTRYLKMVRWAEDFEDYHTTDRGRAPAEVRYKANDTFQRFYELDAGKGAEKLTNKLDGDDELRATVYDLMYEVIESGAEVRKLHKVIGDEDALGLMFKAQGVLETDRDESRTLFEDALEEARRGDARRRKGLGLRQWCEKAVEKLDATAPEKWGDLDEGLLMELHRVLRQASATVEAELESRAPRQTSS